MDFSPHSLANSYPYLQALPAKYAEAAPAMYPLVIHLHGTSERGDGSSDGTRIPSATNQIWKPAAAAGPIKLMTTGDTYLESKGVIAVTPQCPAGSVWDANKLNILVDNLVKTLKVNPNRVHLTGLSLGGGGVCAYALKYRSKLASCAAMAESQYPSTSLAYANLKTLPMWFFHSDNDTVCQVTNPIGAEANALSTGSAAISGFMLSTAKTINPALTAFPMSTHPERILNPKLVTSDQTVRYEGGVWKWTAGAKAPGTALQHATLFNGGGHDSWSRAFGANGSTINYRFWDWLLNQRLNAAHVSSEPATKICEVSSTYCTWTGNWINYPDAPKGYNHTFRYCEVPGSAIAVKPQITVTADYDVQVWWCPGTNRSSAVPIEIRNGMGGTSTVYINERLGGNSFSQVWRGRIYGNGSSQVTIKVPTNTDGRVTFSAVRFVPVTTSNG